MHDKNLEIPRDFFPGNLRVLSEIRFCQRKEDDVRKIYHGSEKELRKPLEKELKEYRSQGISLYLDGKPSTPKNIAKACQIAEDGGYMRDYVEDEKGRIARVDFDFIREK